MTLTIQQTCTHEIQKQADTGSQRCTKHARRRSAGPIRYFQLRSLILGFNTGHLMSTNSWDYGLAFGDLRFRIQG
jgi:hypothetical protein